MAEATLPYNFALAITKSDTVNFPLGVNDGLCDAIYVGGAGIVVAILQDNSAVAFTCIAGQMLPVKAKRVNSTTTSATVMVAMYYV